MTYSMLCLTIESTRLYIVLCMFEHHIKVIYMAAGRCFTYMYRKFQIIVFDGLTLINISQWNGNNNTQFSRILLEMKSHWIFNMHFYSEHEKYVFFIPREVYISHRKHTLNWYQLTRSHSPADKSFPTYISI